MSNDESAQSHEEQDDFFPISDMEEPLESEAEVFSFEQLRDTFVRFRDSEEDGGETHEESSVESSMAEEYDESMEAESSESSPLESSHGEPEKFLDDTSELTPQTVLEAMLFVGDRENRPMMPDHAAQWMRNVSPEEVEQLVERLNERYRFLDKPYHIVRVEEGFRMTLRPEFDPIRASFYGTIRKTRLSQAAIDVLAIVAYKQPISCDEVQKLRKASSGGILALLVKRGLLKTMMVQKAKRTQIHYQTTDRFLKLFNIESLSDLPLAEDIIS